jgi:hypothetical protein
MFRLLRSLLLQTLHARPRNVLAWLCALGLAGGCLITAWHSDGYFSCDFAGQWLLGRMVVKERAAELYWAPSEEEVLASGYAGDELHTMVEQILKKRPQGVEWTGVEGPLYPPTMGLLMAPFALLEPRSAHAVLVLLYTQMAFLVGWLLKDISGGRLRAGEAALFVLVFPHFSMGLVLAQNSALTLTIVSLGWWLRSRRFAFTGGLVWGLLAFKPVFAVAVLWVPLVLGSGRMFLGMLAGSGLFFLATLPFCGFDLIAVTDGMIALNPAHPWTRWLTVGRNASLIYTYDPNWIWFSRDLLGLPRRDMWNWEFMLVHLRSSLGLEPWDEWAMQAVDVSSRATQLGVTLIASVVGLTVLLCAANAVWRRLLYRNFGQPSIGPWPAFALLGGLLTCYHFLWYDLLVFALPMGLLLADAGRLGRCGKFMLGFLLIALLGCTINLAHGSGPIEFPVETALLLLAWLWSGWRMVRESPA